MIQATTQNAAVSTSVLPALLTKAELAQALGMSVRSLEERLKSGQLPAGVRQGRHLYWHPSVASKWLGETFAAQLEWAKG